MAYEGTIEQQQGLGLIKFLFPAILKGQALEVLDELCEAGRAPPKPRGSYEVQPFRFEGELILVPDPEEPAIVAKYGDRFYAWAFARTPRALPSGGGQIRYEVYSLDHEDAKALWERNYKEQAQQEVRT
jgi:hypothetical protein